MLRRGKKKRSPGDPGRLLLAARDEESAILIDRILSRDGHTVISGPLSRDALSALTSADEPFDAVLIDTGTGGTSDGLKLLEQIRSLDGEHADVLVILLGGSERNRMFSWQSGVDGFIVRPVHADEVRSEVADVLARDPKHRQSHRQAEIDDLGD